MAKAKSELAGVEFAASISNNALLQELTDNINNYEERRMNKWKSNWFRFQLRTPLEEGSDLGGADADSLDLGFLGLDEEPVVDEQEAAGEPETDQAATVQGEGQEADPAAVAAADQQVAQPIRQQYSTGSSGYRTG